MNPKELRQNYLSSLNAYHQISLHSSKSVNITTSNPSTANPQLTKVIFSKGKVLQVFKIFRAILIEASRKKWLRLSPSASFLVISPSRFENDGDLSISEKLEHSIECALSSCNAKIPLLRLCRDNPIIFTSALYREIHYLNRHDINHLFGYFNVFTVYVLGLTSYAYLKAESCFARKTYEALHVNPSLISCFILGSVLYFQLIRQPKSAIFLTSNSRLSDCLMAVFLTLNVTVTEYLHGIPDIELEKKYIYLLENYKNIRIIPLLPDSLSCSATHEYFNVKLGIILHTVRGNLSHSSFTTCSQIASTGASTLSSASIYVAYVGAHNAGYESFYESQTFHYELIALNILGDIAANHTSVTFVYCPHPSQTRIGMQLNWIPEYFAIAQSGTYKEILRASHVLSLFSSAAFESQFLNRKVAMLHPEISLIFSEKLLKRVTSINIQDRESSRRDCEKFLGLAETLG